MLNKLKAAWTWIRGEIVTYPMWLPAAIAAVLAQGTTLGWWTLDATQTGEVTAVATAVLGLTAAFLTSNVGVTVIVTALQAVGALCIGFTFHGSQKVGLYIGAIVAIIGFLGHTQNSPKYGPRGVKAPSNRLRAALREASRTYRPAPGETDYSVTAAGEPISEPAKPARKLSGAAAKSHAKKQAAETPPEHQMS